MNVGPQVGGVNVYLAIEACSKRGAGGRVSGRLCDPSATAYTERIILGG
jgi:hypothetical protein